MNMEYQIMFGGSLLFVFVVTMMIRWYVKTKMICRIKRMAGNASDKELRFIRHATRFEEKLKNIFKQKRKITKHPRSTKTHERGVVTGESTEMIKSITEDPNEKNEKENSEDK